MSRRLSWTRERILRHLLEREAQGLPLSVGGQGVELGLYAAARRIFGSWRNAVHAAGIPAQRALTWERWSPGRILVVIRHLAQRKRPLTVAQMEQRYGNLMSTARRVFGSWNKAVVAAGVDPTRLQRVVPWNRERVIENILTRALRNEPLVARQVEPRSLVDAAQRFFGSWQAAVVAAGLDPQITKLPPKHPRPSQTSVSSARTATVHGVPPSWSRERVLAAIQQRAQQGQSLRARDVASQHARLYRAGVGLFKRWAHALRAAGIKSPPHSSCPGPSDMPAPSPSDATGELKTASVIQSLPLSLFSSAATRP